MDITYINSVLYDINNLINNNYFSGNEEIHIEISEFYDTNDENHKNFIKKLGKYKQIKKNDKLIINKNKCSICLENYKINEYKRILPSCNHCFHKKCIDKWFKENDSKECPICRCNYNKL